MQPSKTSGRAAEKARKLADYDAWYGEQIRIGVEAADSGEVVTAEEFESGMDRHMAKLTAKFTGKASMEPASTSCGVFSARSFFGPTPGR